jgi:hypothetical protein
MKRNIFSEGFPLGTFILVSLVIMSMRSGRPANLSARCRFRHCSCRYFANASTVKLFQERGEKFRDGIVEAIVPSAQPLPDFPQPWAPAQDVAMVG